MSDARKASFSLSPLARPHSPVHRLAAGVQDYLYFPDPEPLYVAAGALVANMLKGSTVWLMLVGPPASGKTELVMSMLDLPGVRQCGDFSPASLLSGVKRKDWAKGAHGGLLHELSGDPHYRRGALIMTDFNGAVLAQDPRRLRATLGAMQQIYDGSYEREVGTEGAKKLSWVGRVGFITGCTDIIDRHQETISANGPRFIYWRYPASDGEGEMHKRMQIADPREMQIAMRVMMAQFIEELRIDWDSHLPRPLEYHEIERIGAISQLTVKARSEVTRDAYLKDIIAVGAAEYPTRIASILSQLYLAMDFIGVESTDRWKAICKIGLDCMPNNRQIVLRHLSHGRLHTFKQIADEMHVSWPTGKRILADLEAHKLIVKNGDEGFKLSAWTQHKLERGWGGSTL